MTVQCPNCGHSGTLPSSMKSGQHKIRCRRCGVKFETQAKVADQEIAIEPEVEPDGLAVLVTDLGIKPESQSDEENSGIDVGELAIDISDDELPVRVESRAMLPPEPWFYGFLDGWGTFYLYAAGITFVAVFALFVLVLVNAKMEFGGFSVVIVILSLVIVAIFGTFIVTCAAGIFLIVDQARNIRRLQFGPNGPSKATKP